MKQKKVLCLFDYVARTGFGTVSRNIVKEITKHFGENLQLDIVAINYFGEPYYETPNIFVCPAKKHDGNEDVYGRYFFLKMLNDSDEYDAIFICQDLGVVRPFIEVINHIKKEKKEKNKKIFKSIFYFPVDCAIIEELVKDIEHLDVLITYTEHARGEVLRFKPELKTKIKVIPHGNNSKDFFPIEDISDFRKEYFGKNADKFIITNISRNQPRKDIPNTIFGFIEAKKIWDKNLPQPFLYLHCHPKDPMGWDIRAIMLQTDLVEDVDYKLLPLQYELESVDILTLNKIYNASDCFLSTALGEGWGLCFSESAATKTPIVAPYNTSFMEMSNFGKNAWMLYTQLPTCNQIDNVIREQSDPAEIAETLLELAKSVGTEEYKGKLNRSYEWVKKLEWSDICKKWIECFKNI